MVSKKKQAVALTRDRDAIGAAIRFNDLVFEGGSPCTVTGVPIAEDALVLEAVFDLVLADAVRVGISYSGQFGDCSHQQDARGVLSWSFGSSRALDLDDAVTTESRQSGLGPHRL